MTQPLLRQRVASFVARIDNWLSDILAGAIEADLRDAGYEVLGRAERGAVAWREPLDSRPPDRPLASLRRTDTD